MSKRVVLPLGKGWSAGRVFVPRSNCAQCGKEFYAPPVQRRRGGGRFCSKRCSGAWRRAQAVPNAVCAGCGASVRRAPSNLKPRVFCSKSCQRESAIAARTRGCVCCGRRFRASSRDQRYCSLGCRPPSRPSQPRPLAICHACGVMFSPGAGSTGKFCSITCVGRSKVGPRSPGQMYSSARGGKREDLSNQYFRSAWEANWARYLTWLKSIGEIRAWEFEVVTFEFAKIKRGTRFYTPDFKVTNKDGSVEYHEVKGYMDQRSATKLKRMAKYYPLTRIVLIDKAAYSSVAKKVSGLIAGWEKGTLRSSLPPRAEARPA